MGSDPPGVLTDLVVPALRSIGDGWAAGELSVADEHRATAVAFRVVGRLGLQFGRRGKRRGKVALAAPAGDLHTLPVAIAADLLRWRGFETVELGANSPAEASPKRLGGRAGWRRSASFRARAVLTPRSARPSPPSGGRGRISRSCSAGGHPRPWHADQLGCDIFTGTGSSAAVEAVEAVTGARRGRSKRHG